jgi:hypothetical protein
MPNRFPSKGNYDIHVLVVFPIDEQPWRSMLSRFRDKGRLLRQNQLITIAGSIVGVLDENAFETRPAEYCTIPIIIPQTWNFPDPSRSGTPTSSGTPATPMSIKSTSGVHLPRRKRTSANIMAQNSSPLSGSFANPTSLQKTSLRQQTVADLTSPPPQTPSRNTRRAMGYTGSTARKFLACLHHACSLQTHIRLMPCE